MSPLDWFLVILLNCGIVLFAVIGARNSSSSSEFFLGGRSVPWWIVGISAFVTAIDSSDLVADSGGIYSLGISYFVTNWVGTVAGWIILAFFVAVPMYRFRMYTNSEYLEARFGPGARVLSSLVQVQYRTMVLANISTTLYLVLTVVGGFGAEAWLGVLIIVLMSLSYSFIGGSKSVAITDVAQSVVMITASLVLFMLVWNAAGGWSGTKARLEKVDSNLAARMMRVGTPHVERMNVGTKPDSGRSLHVLLGGDLDQEAGTLTRLTPAWIVCLSFVLVGMAYSIVNHEQSMRFFAARSDWDMKMAVSVAGLLLIGITFFNLMMGVMGRALFPTLESLPVSDSLKTTADAIYPILVRDFTGPGFCGIVVAGIIAAAISTYAGIGTAMSALMTRDIYARLLVRNASDQHYLTVGRWLTIAILLGSFAYIPSLLARGMMIFYLDLVGAFVIPLLAIYLMGIFTPVHRKSGTIGLLVGVTYGGIRLLAIPIFEQTGVALLPSTMLNSYCAYPISLGLTAGAMVIISIILGWEKGALHPLAEFCNAQPENQSFSLEHAVHDINPDVRSSSTPAILALFVLGLGTALSFYVFW